MPFMFSHQTDHSKHMINVKQSIKTVKDKIIVNIKKGNRKDVCYGITETNIEVAVTVGWCHL